MRPFTSRRKQSILAEYFLHFWHCFSPEEREDDGEGKSRTESSWSDHKDADADFLPLGWDEIPLTRYAELIQLIHYHRPHSVFLLLSNHMNTLRRLRAMLPANVHLSIPQDTPSSDVADTESFTGAAEKTKESSTPQRTTQKICTEMGAS